MRETHRQRHKTSNRFIIHRLSSNGSPDQLVTVQQKNHLPTHPTMAASLKRMLKRKERSTKPKTNPSKMWQTTTTNTAVHNNHDAVVLPLLRHYTQKQQRHDRRMIKASRFLQSKQKFAALSSSLVVAQEAHHPRKFVRRLDWDYVPQEYDQNVVEHEQFPIDWDRIEQRKQLLVNHRAIDTDEPRTATQPFVSLVPERRRNAALANAVHYLSEEGRNQRSLTTPPICCHESLILKLGRESNICFGCGSRKPLSITLCWKCYEDYLAKCEPNADMSVEEETYSIMLFLSFTVGTRLGPKNCGQHRHVDNACSLVENADEYCRLVPRIGLQTSLASEIILQSSATLNGTEMLSKVMHKIQRKQHHSNYFRSLLLKHSTSNHLLQHPSDRYVTRTQTLPKAWHIALCIGIVAQRFKKNCPSVLRKEIFMRKTVARIKMRTVYAVFNKWVFMVAEVIRNRQKAQGCLKRFLMREVNKAFNQWHIYAHRQRQTKDLARKVIARQLGMLLVVFFEKWADRTQQSAVEKQKKIQDMIAKWRLMPAMLALRAWVDVVVMMKKARKFARRILMLACARSLNAWLLLVENNKRVRAFLRRMVLRMQNRRVARLYDGWLLYTDMMLERKELKIQKVLHRMNTRWERQFFINRK
jgi:hypothetical protein